MLNGETSVFSKDGIKVPGGLGRLHSSTRIQVREGPSRAVERQSEYCVRCNLSIRDIVNVPTCRAGRSSGEQRRAALGRLPTYQMETTASAEAAPAPRAGDCEESVCDLC